MQLYAKQTLGTLDVLFFQVKKQAQYMTPDQAILSLDPSNHEWFIWIMWKAQITHLDLRQDGSILALGFGSTSRPSDWRVRLDEKLQHQHISSFSNGAVQLIYLQVHGIRAAASWVQIGGGVNLRQVDAQNCSMSRFYLLLAVMRLLDLFWVK